VPIRIDARRVGAEHVTIGVPTTITVPKSIFKGKTRPKRSEQAKNHLTAGSTAKTKADDAKERYLFSNVLWSVQLTATVGPPRSRNDLSRPTVLDVLIAVVSTAVNMQDSLTAICIG
jgi:hypothetical protein